MQEGLQFSTFQKDRFLSGSGVTFGPLLGPFWGHLASLYLPRGASGPEKVHFRRVMKTYVFSSIFKESRNGQGGGQELSEQGPVVVNP